MSISFIKNTLGVFDTLTIYQRKQFLLSILHICIFELENISLDIVDNRIIYFNPLMITSAYISEFFSGGDTSVLNTIHAYIDNHPTDNTTETLAVLSDTVSFIDQLPTENLLDDAERERYTLFQKSREIYAKLSSDF